MAKIHLEYNTISGWATLPCELRRRQFEKSTSILAKIILYCILRSLNNFSTLSKNIETMHYAKILKPGSGRPRFFREFRSVGYWHTVS